MGGGPRSRAAGAGSGRIPDHESRIPEPPSPGSRTTSPGSAGSRVLDRRRRVGSGPAGSGPGRPPRRGQPPRSIRIGRAGRRPEVGRPAILVRKLAAQDRTRHELATAAGGEERARARWPRGCSTDSRSSAWSMTRRTRGGGWSRGRPGGTVRGSALRRELAGKGVDRDTIDDALAGVGTEDETGAARAYADKVRAAMSGLDPRSVAGGSPTGWRRRGFGSGDNRSGSERFGLRSQAAVADVLDPARPPPNLQTARYPATLALI